MRRVLMVLTVAALVAAMMVSAGPAQANETSFQNSTNVVAGDGFIGFGGDIDDDDIDFGGLFAFGDFDDVFGDDDDDQFENSLFVACPVGCNVGDFDFPDIDTNIA
jgi:hypothetical protein